MFHDPYLGLLVVIPNYKAVYVIGLLFIFAILKYMPKLHIIVFKLKSGLKVGLL